MDRKADAPIDSLHQTFSPFYIRYYRNIYDFFLYRGITQEDSQDLAQEVFFRAYRFIQKKGGSVQLDLGWLLVTASNLRKNWIRGKTALKRSGIEKSFDERTDTLDSSSLAESNAQGQPHHALEVKEKHIKLQRAIAALPPQMRRCFVLRGVDQRKYAEIASLMGISIDTVKSNLSHARSRLKDDLNLS